jgi:hypothetical protein
MELRLQPESSVPLLGLGVRSLVEISGSFVDQKLPSTFVVFPPMIDGQWHWKQQSFSDISKTAS